MKHLTTLIFTALLTTTVVFPMQGNANEEQQAQYEMVAIGNHAFGGLVLKGDYQLAVERITGSRNFAPYATATNLCVALTLLGNYDLAEPRCNEAIKLADKPRVPTPKRWRGILQLAKQRSIAYSNRGVMHMLRGNVSGATEDFQTAIERKGKANLSAPSQNLVKTSIITTEPSVATVIH
jgi:Flp pilus assembly protein TadD